jgi:histone H1/5
MKRNDEERLESTERYEALMKRNDEERLESTERYEALMKESTEKYEALGKELGDLKSDLATTKSDLATTKSDLATTKSDLATTKSKLATTKSKLATAVKNLEVTKSELEVTKSQLAVANEKNENDWLEVETNSKAQYKKMEARSTDSILGMRELVTYLRNTRMDELNEDLPNTECKKKTLQDHASYIDRRKV